MGRLYTELHCDTTSLSKTPLQLYLYPLMLKLRCGDRERTTGSPSTAHTAGRIHRKNRTSIIARREEAGGLIAQPSSSGPPTVGSSGAAEHLPQHQQHQQQLGSSEAAEPPLQPVWAKPKGRREGGEATTVTAEIVVGL